MPLKDQSKLLPLPWGFPGGSVVKHPPANAGDAGSTLGSGRFPGRGNGNPLQYSRLGNSLDRAWWTTVHGVVKCWTQLSKTTTTSGPLELRQNFRIYDSKGETTFILKTKDKPQT